MSLESGLWVADLNALNPPGADPKSMGDDHLRLIKKTLLDSFAGFPGAILVTGVDGGAVNAYTLTPANPLPSYTTKMIVVFAPTVTNTGAVTLNISALGVKNLLSMAGAALVANDLVLGGIYSASYDGTQFRLLSVTKNYVDQAVISGAIPGQALGFFRSDGTAAGFTQTHTGYAQKEVRGADIASAATINLTTATGNLVHVTGNVGITGITIPVGAEYTVIFDGTPVITHSAALVLPDAANITASAGSKMIVRGDTAGAVVVLYNAGSATAAEIRAATATSKPMTPAAHLSAIGFNAFFQTADQTIVSAGALTIPHGLGRAPFMLQGFIKNITADIGFSVGDIVPVSLGVNDFSSGGGGTSIYGVAITFDATNIYVRYAAGSQVFLLMNKTTGVGTGITTSRWAFFLRVLG